MKLIEFNNGIAVNVERIDGVERDFRSNNLTKIYIGGASSPFVTDEEYKKSYRKDNKCYERIKR